MAPACNKGSKGASNAPRDTDHEMNQEGAPYLLVDAFQHDDIEALHAVSLEDLHDELTDAAFGDIAKVLKWLGPLNEVIYDEADEQPAGSRYTYELDFEKGLVHLTVTLLNTGELVNFAFAGDDFIAAEHGALDDRYATFKVYDFKWTDELGNQNPKVNKMKQGRIDYRVIVGGLEAELGEHHLSFEKIVTAEDGTELLHEPIEFDRRFETSPEGIPRARIQMFLLLSNAVPGKYTLTLRMKDNISGNTLEHKAPFEIIP